MKRALLLSVCLLAVSSLAFAQAGSIGLFADVGGAGCDVYDVGGLAYVYVIHVYCASPGATAVEFMVDYLSWGCTFSHLFETVTAPYLGIGSSPVGITIAFGQCVPCPNMVLTIGYMASGTSATCSYIQVVDHPGAIPPGIWVVDCDDNKLAGTGGDVVVNPDETCMCDVPVEETSWGQIKALYQ